MRVYHFLPANWALDDVAKRRIRISRVAELNDPFELWYVSQPRWQIREALRQYKEEMNEKFGLLCFSRRWQEPLLWSQYADRHRGICLGFNVDDRGLKAVSYVTKRPPMQRPPTWEGAQALLFTKYSGWRYEEEYRCWFRLGERDPSGHYFYPFDGMVELREVIAGPLCNATRSDIDQSLQGQAGEITVVKARLAFNSFRVVRNKRGFSN